MRIRSRVPIRLAVLASAAVAAAAAGCTTPYAKGPVAAPMNKPVALSSDSGSGAIESARRQLQGTWELVALESAPSEDGARVPVRASGTLTYDEYGNLTIDAHTTDLSAPAAAREANKLSFKGRAVIDVTNRELKLMDLTGNVDPSEVLSPERRRRYEIDADTLKLSSFNERGTVTAIATWHRRN